VKGLAWAAEKPCIPVSTLEAMAWPLAHLEGSIVCAMDARRQQIYNAAFLADSGALERLREDRALSLEEAAAGLAGLDGPMTIVGDGAQMCFEFFTARGIDCRLAPVHLRLQSAAGVALAAWRRRTETVSAQELTPVYLRLSQAERERLAKGESI
jgi:tRNA threonylcarbamoyladenosine biosynthesis protein TsaB